MSSFDSLDAPLYKSSVDVFDSEEMPDGSVMIHKLIATFAILEIDSDGKVVDCRRPNFRTMGHCKLKNGDVIFKVGLNLERWDNSMKTHRRKYEGHEGLVCHVTQLQNGDIASVGNDRTLRIWDLDSGECKHVFKSECDSHTCIFQMDDDHVISTGSKHADVWKISTGECINTLNYSRDSNPLLLQDGTFLSVPQSTNNLSISNPVTGECIRTFKGHTERILKVIQLRDGKIVSSSLDSTVRVWDCETGECVWSYDHQCGVGPILQLRNGDFVSGDNNSQIRVWDTNSWSLKYRMNQHRGQIFTITELQTGRIFSGSGADFCVWDPFVLKDVYHYARIWSDRDSQSEFDACKEIVQISHLKHTPWKIVIDKYICPWSVYYTQNPVRSLKDRT